MKLNLGCGFRWLPGYLNIDIQTLEHIATSAAYYGEPTAPAPGVEFLQHDLREGIPAGGVTVSEIILRETFEHLTYAEGLALLKECARVLVPGGTLDGEVPDLGVVIDLFLKGAKPESFPDQPGMFSEWRENMIAQMLYADPYTPGYSHKSMYTHSMLKQVAEQAGLSACTWNNPDFEHISLHFLLTKPEVA